MSAEYTSPASDRPIPEIPDISWLAASNDLNDTEAKRMRSVIESRPDRLGRIDAASSGEISGPLGPVHFNSREWSIRLVSSGRDPRGWNSTELAHVIHATRLVLRSPQTDRRGEELFQTLISSMKGMGMRRTAQLTLSDLELSRIAPEFGRGNAPKFYTSSDRYKHFPSEFLLYEAEWLAAHPRPTRSDSAPQWEGDKILYETQRWLETDDQAPHPDVEKIESELRKLESLEEKSP